MLWVLSQAWALGKSHTWYTRDLNKDLLVLEDDSRGGGRRLEAQTRGGLISMKQVRLDGRRADGGLTWSCWSL